MTDHQCSHRLGDGRLCGSPRLSNKKYCYFHTRLHESFLLPGHRHYNPPPLTDLHHIALALTHVWSALAKSMITHKQACAMAYQIQLAKQTFNDIMKMEKELKAQGAPSLPAVGQGGISKADTTPAPGEDAQSTPDPAPHDETDDDEIIYEEPSGPRYDPDHPPLVLDPALRPMLSSPPPSLDSTPTFIPISEKEFQWMNNYVPQGLIDPIPDNIIRRRFLHARFKDDPNPTPDEIAKALLEVEEDQLRMVEDREKTMRAIRAKKRDQRNREILGF